MSASRTWIHINTKHRIVPVVQKELLVYPNVPSLDLNVERASLSATLANLINDYKPELLGPIYGRMCQKLQDVCCYLHLIVGGPISQFVWFYLQYGWVSESDLVVLTNTRSQDISDYVEPDVELVVSPVKNAAVSAT
jgi:hypothetical protein